MVGYCHRCIGTDSRFRRMQPLEKRVFKKLKAEDPAMVGRSYVDWIVGVEESVL